MYISTQHIQSLASVTEHNNCVSIYLPTTRQTNGDALQQDITRFKNAISHLKQKGKSGEILAKKLTDELDSLLNDVEFWKHQDNGLAVFTNNNEPLQSVPLPYSTYEHTQVEDTYVIAPLLLQSSLKNDFYVFDCNLNSPRLLRSLGNTLEQVEVADMPGSFDEEHSDVEYKKELQHRYGPRGTANDNAYHAHDASDLVDNDVEKYLRAAASAVDRHLGEQTTPLIISGTTNRIGTIKKMLGYTSTLQTALEGNYQNANVQELFDLTSPIAQEHYKTEHDAKIQQVLDAHPEQVASTNEEIAKAAFNARIDTLLVPCYTYTTDGNSTNYHKQVVFDDGVFSAEIEKLCRDVLSYGGTILATDRDNDRLSQPIALCRY